jgi:hypothetical protein
MDDAHILTYGGKEARQIMKLFKDTNLKTGFCTHNTKENILKPTPQIHKYKQSSIYQMK